MVSIAYIYLILSICSIMLHSKSLLKYFSSLSLPPTNYKPQSFTGNPEQVLSKRQKYIPLTYSTYYKTPLIITEGHLQYLFDHKGNRYLDLDANGGQVNIGHNHPAIRKIIQDQAGRLIHTSTIYMNQSQGEYSKLLCDQLGDGFNTVYLCNTAGEAMDFAVFVAKVFTQQREVYAYRNAYHNLVGHGRTVTNLGQWSSGKVDKLDCQRLIWPSSTSNAQTAFNQVKGIVQNSSGEKPGLLVYQPLQTKAGVHFPPQGYLKSTVDYFKQKQAVTISDESNTGLGRIGQEGWGFKWQKHSPNFVTLGASLGNGSSLGAVVGRKQHATTIKHMWFNTFAAGYLQTKIGIEVINTINRDKLKSNAESVGKYLLEGLQRVSKASDFIGEVRGKGLLLGIDVVDSKQTQLPSKERALKLMQLARERQILFGRGGKHGNTLLVTPPLCITLEDAKYAVQAFQDALSQLK